MQTDKSNFLVKAGFVLTSGLTAAFTAYLFMEQIRKYKKQREKSEIDYIERKIQQKMLQVKQESSLAQTNQPKNVHQRKFKMHF